MITIIAGLFGTVAMTLFVEVFCFLSKKPYRVVRILARMFPFNRHEQNITWLSYSSAVLVHYSIGVLFAVAFYLLREYEIFDLNLFDTLLFGALAGVVGVLGWRIFFLIHPNPPGLNLNQYLCLIWVGHLIFAAGIFITHLVLRPTPVQASIPIC